MADSSTIWPFLLIRLDSAGRSAPQQIGGGGGGSFSFVITSLFGYFKGLKLIFKEKNTNRKIWKQLNNDGLV